VVASNRASSPDVFLTELERVLDAIALLPELGAPARNVRIEGVRRIYYRRVLDSLQVLAVWHTSRGKSPGL
jgi:hypothetical protein